VVEACLERIERLDGQVHAFITLTADRARQGPAARPAPPRPSSRGARTAGRCTACRSR
jgi:Asp-tRNA(Asn)/Glu-tRNA(Gln) amidotransferase A subunit family amidase